MNEAFGKVRQSDSAASHGACGGTLTPDRDVDELVGRIISALARRAARDYAEAARAVGERR